MSLLPWRSNPSPNDELQTLKEKMEQLRSKVDDIQCQVRNEELQPGKKRKSEVALWLKRVEELEEDFKSIKEEVLSVEKRGHPSCRGLLYEMKGMSEQVDQLQKQGDFSQGLVLDDLKPGGIELVTEKLEGSTPLVVKHKVWSGFTRGESRVGIFGMGGVGKTTVAMHVNNEILSGNNCFKHVFYVTVSRGSSVHKLQEDISKALTLALSTEDETRRAAELRMSLKRRHKSLLILDDIWEDIPMEKVGVTVEGDGCKLLITTRKRDVCRKMNCSSIVEMKPLLEEEAWDLFVNQLGNYEQLSNEAKCIARCICEECSGLPLAIITMARCMRGEFDEHVLREMLRQVQNPSRNQEDMDTKVFSILKLSYERLNNDKLRECLLYCALYPEEGIIPRDELIIRFIAAGLIDGSSGKENIDLGHFNLNALESASLLESLRGFRGRRCVKMHDLIRDMALKIIGSKVMVEAEKGLEEIPEKDKWTNDLVYVSLMDNAIQEIGNEFCPECPNLSVLILRNNPLTYISHSLFVHMGSLRCLDLSNTKLKVIPSLAGLTQLRDLNLGRTWIKNLPQGFEELVNLKYLDITGTIIQGIPDALLCKLNKLESFLSNIQTNILAKSLMSLRQLWRFEGRIADFDAFNQFVGSNCFNQLERYSFLVGGVCNSLYISLCARRIAIHCCQLSIGRQVGFKVPHNVQSLHLERCGFWDDCCLLEALPSLCGATELQELFLLNCDRIKYIVSDAELEQVSTPLKAVRQLHLAQLYGFLGLYEGEPMHSHVLFGGLRELGIYNCANVKQIWLPNGILPNLGCIEVVQCRNLKQVFATTAGAAIELPCLEKVAVKSCPNLHKLWSVKDELPSLQCVSVQACYKLNHVFATTTTTVKCPKLCSLTLEWLPKLKSIICSRNVVFFPQLQDLYVSECPQLKNVGLLNHSMQSLRIIRIGNCRQMEEIFEMGDDAIQLLPGLEEIFLSYLPELTSICSRSRVFFSQLQTLHVCGCPMLKKVGLLNHSMQSLREIRILKCTQMEEIFEMRDGAGYDAIQMPNLETLCLRDLPELTSMSRKAFVCNSIERVTIGGVHKLENCPISVPRILLANTSNRPIPYLEGLDKPTHWWNSLHWNDPSTKVALHQLGCFYHLHDSTHSVTRLRFDQLVGIDGDSEISSEDDSCESRSESADSWAPQAVF